ncbi:MAG: cox cluster protein [Haloarculaceae archaeon]
MSETATVWRGPRFVTALYVAVVALTGVFGFVIGAIRPENLEPELFMLIDLPPTPLGVALYGMLTVGILLGGLLLLVRYVGSEFDPHRLE